MRCIEQIELALNHKSATVSADGRKGLELALKYIKEDFELCQAWDQFKDPETTRKLELADAFDRARAFGRDDD